MAFATPTDPDGAPVPPQVSGSEPGGNLGGGGLAAAYPAVPDSLASSGPSTEQTEGDQPVPEAAPNKIGPEGSGAPVVTSAAPTEDPQTSDPKPSTTTTPAKSARHSDAKILLPLFPASLDARFAGAADPFAPPPTADDIVLLAADESPRARTSGPVTESSSFVAASVADAEVPPTPDEGPAGEPAPVPTLEPTWPPRAVAHALPDRIPEPLTLLGVPVAGALPLDLAGFENYAREALGAAGFEWPREEAGGKTYWWVAAAALLTGGAAYWSLRRPRPRPLVWRGLGPDPIPTDWGDWNGTHTR